MKTVYRGLGRQEMLTGIENFEPIGNRRSHQGQLWELPYLRHIPTPERMGRSCQPDSFQKDPLLQPSITMGADLEDEASQNNSSQNNFGQNSHSAPQACPDRRQNLQKLANAYHQLAIQRRLEHRLQVAKARHDQALVKLLESEFFQLQQAA